MPLRTLTVGLLRSPSVDSYVRLIPVEGGSRDRLLEALRSVPVLVAQAQARLDAVAADYADLALRNLTNADGVGHGRRGYARAPRGRSLSAQRSKTELASPRVGPCRGYRTRCRRTG